jgi:hypothetical protein
MLERDGGKRGGGVPRTVKVFFPLMIWAGGAIFWEFVLGVGLLGRSRREIGIWVERRWWLLLLLSLTSSTRLSRSAEAAAMTRLGKCERH